MQTAPPTLPSAERHEETPTLSDLLWEVIDLAGGAAVALLPLLILAVPSAVLFLVLPALVLLAVAAVPVVVAGVVLVPAYLLARFLRRGLGAAKMFVSGHHGDSSGESIAPCGIPTFTGRPSP